MRTLLIDIHGGMSLDGKFPGLRVGEIYYGRVTASGGTPFYVYRIVRGVLPAGLALDGITGEVTGTPTSDAMTAITVRATDLQGMFIERVFVIPGTVVRAASDNTASMFWRFKPIPYAAPFPADIPDEAGVNYDDSAWAQSQGPFGNLSTNPGVGTRAHEHDPRLPARIGTSLSKGTGTWLRRHVWLESVPSGGLDVVAYIDNYLRIYVNGTVGFSVNNKYDGTGDGNIPATNLVRGDNVFAVWCMDDAGDGGDDDASYFGFAIEPAS